MKKLLTATVLATGLFASSCIGPNKAFNGIADWNAEVTDNKWTNELIHLACWIVPVYPIALWGDIVIFNSIEFWGGDNPID